MQRSSGERWVPVWKLTSGLTGQERCPTHTQEVIQATYPMEEAVTSLSCLSIRTERSLLIILEDRSSYLTVGGDNCLESWNPEFVLKSNKHRAMN